jgi:hypothetical protein
MEDPRRPIEPLQAEVARLIATSPAGEGLRLVGGFRYRLLDRSCRASLDIDYHWEGDLREKRDGILALFRKRLLPEVRRLFGLDGTAEPASAMEPGAEPDSPFVSGIVLALFRRDLPGSRLELPVEITRIPCKDAPIVRTAGGTVYLTASDADMVEGKVIALVRRVFLQERDILDLYLFQDGLLPDSPVRLRDKLESLALEPGALEERIAKVRRDLVVHARGVDRLLEEQVDGPSAENLRRAGGGRRICEAVVDRLEKVLGAMRGPWRR